MTYTKPRISMPFINGKHHFQPITESAIAFTHHCNGKNLKTKIPAITKDETVQRVLFLPDNQITFHKASV